MDDKHLAGLPAGRPPWSAEERARAAIARALSIFEDAVYIALALMLAYTTAALLVTGAVTLWQNLMSGAQLTGLIQLLDRSLLVLMVVEILYTVRVSFRAHSLEPEPFLVVGLIAVTRRILVVTAELSQLVDKGELPFRNAMMEVGLLTGMVLALGTSLALVRRARRSDPTAADRDSRRSGG